MVAKAKYLQTQRIQERKIQAIIVRKIISSKKMVI